MKTINIMAPITVALDIVLILILRTEKIQFLSNDERVPV